MNKVFPWLRNCCLIHRAATVSYTHLDVYKRQKERLSQLHAVFHMDEQLPFQFEWDWLAPSGLSTKDFIAPSSFEFRTGKQFRICLLYTSSARLKLKPNEVCDVYEVDTKGA